MILIIKEANSYNNMTWLLDICLNLIRIEFPTEAC